MWNRKLKQASTSSRGSSSCTRDMEDNCADFISQLPDHLLLHIFSFLDETAVFQSSVLSKRWHHLWTLVPFPVYIIEMRVYFKEQKADIRERKLSKEKGARNTISELTFEVVRAIIHYLFVAGSLTLMDSIMFVVVNLLITLQFMVLMYSAYCDYYSSLSTLEEYLKRLQMRDSRLTSNANSL